jgi:mRNA-degrading endonuclease YafQ of YafQ-DinJ toxin-antitoxin module
MVVYSDTAKLDLADILFGLITWEKHPLEFEHARQYVNDIANFCDKLDCRSIHFKAVYRTHQYYGNYTCQYKRNTTTSWYIIYNLDRHGNVYINKIISNYQTTE